MNLSGCKCTYSLPKLAKNGTGTSSKDGFAVVRHSFSAFFTLSLIALHQKKMKGVLEDKPNQYTLGQKCKFLLNKEFYSTPKAFNSLAQD